MSNSVQTKNMRFRVGLKAYEPCVNQRAHCDDASRISLLLQGSFAEETRMGGLTASCGDVLFKSGKISHETRIGAKGAVIASLVFDPDCGDEETERLMSETWRLSSKPEALRHFLALLEAGPGHRDEDAKAHVADLLTLANPVFGDRQNPPPWLLRLKRDLEADTLGDVNVSAHAKEAGCHPVHVSRAFRQFFGTSITDHARFHSVRRAMPALSEGVMSLSEIAIASGFYDQSHMNRAFKAVLGRTPGRLRKLMGYVAA